MEIERDRPELIEEIEITPAMIEAGVSQLADYDDRFEGRKDVVASIFRAMISARDKVCRQYS